MLGTTIISTLVVVIHALSDWVTPIPACCLLFQQLLFPTLLVKLCSLEIDVVPVCGCPLVSSMV
jgi:hypothetical protein